MKAGDIIVHKTIKTWFWVSETTKFGATIKGKDNFVGHIPWKQLEEFEVMSNIDVELKKAQGEKQ